MVLAKSGGGHLIVFHKAVCMKRFCTPLRVLLIALGLAACDQSGPGLPAVPLVPLAVGNTWTYEGWYLDSRNSFRFTVTTPDTLSVMIDGRRRLAYQQATIREGSEDPHRWLIANEADGFYYYGGVAATDTFAYHALAFRYPGRTGETYALTRLAFSNSRLEFYAQEPLPMTLLAKDQPCKVLNTIRTCYVYLFNFRPEEDVLATWDVYSYFVPGIGSIADTIRSHLDGTVRQQHTLTAYTLH